jgi:hypothetical protein
MLHPRVANDPDYITAGSAYQARGTMDLKLAPALLCALFTPRGIAVCPFRNCSHPTCTNLYFSVTDQVRKGTTF